jgi:putative lipoic acid-binding regulatory protein
MENLLLTYPCTWSYRLIGEDCDLMIREIPARMGSIKHEISTGNRSKRGKYVSINIDAIVHDNHERLSVATLLQSIPTVKMVI